MIRLFALVLLCLLVTNSAKAANTKITAIISDRNLNELEYKALEGFATNLGRDIKKNWFPADYPNRKLRTVVKIDFMPDGKHFFEFRERSNHQSFDDTCYMAINRSLEGVAYPHLNSIEYLFEYDNHKMKVPRELVRWPAQLGIGVLSKKLGVNHFVTIPIY